MARDLIRLGLELAVDDGDPLDVLATIESWRAASLRFPAVRPPDDDVLADDLSRIRVLDSEMRDAQGRGLPTADLFARRAEIEARVRRRSLVSRGSGPGAEHAVVDDIIAGLGDAQIAAFFVDRGRLGSVMVDGDGATLQDVGDAETIADLTHSVVFMLHRMATGAGSEASLQAAAAAFADDTRRLASMLLPGGDRPCILIPTGVLHRLPWQALAASRTMTVVPSLGSWGRAQARWRPAGADSAALLVAGPGLPGASHEVEGLASQWAQARALHGEAATVARVLAELESADVVHLAAHGEFRADNPLFTSLRMHDGPITVYDLETVRSIPSTVVVPSCDIAVSEVAKADELLGFTAALLALGVTGLVAPVVPIPDRATAPVMMLLHQHIRSGTPVGPALSAAVSATEPSSLEQMAVTAAFVSFGA